MPPAKAEGDALTDCSGTGEELCLLNQCKPADMPVKSHFRQVRVGAFPGRVELGETPFQDLGRNDSILIAQRIDHSHHPQDG